MNKSTFSNTLSVALLTAVVSCPSFVRAAGVNRSVTYTESRANGSTQFVVFRDSTEAGLLRRAYVILATGDHDYKGHRAKAMQAVEAAGKLLDMDLAGDLKDRSPQVLSDDKLREAQQLITQVLGSAEVKGQKHIVKHLTEAVDQISEALSVRYS